MSLYPSNDPSIIKFTKNLKEVLLLCDTGISLSDDCPPIFLARPEIEMNVYPTLRDYFDINPSVFGEKPFSFFVGRKLLLREVRGYESVIQLVDKRYNMVELKMKPNIEDVMRRKKLGRIKKNMRVIGNAHTKRAVTNKINK